MRVVPRRGDCAVGRLTNASFPRRESIWWIALVAAFAVMLLINPGGFIGGGNDDWHYLHAARCLREHGLCLPHDHWETRWPVSAPIAFFSAIFGESRFSVSLAPGLASLLAFLLLAKIGNRLFAPPVGWVAALLFLMIPAFSVQLTDPSVEATELAFIFAGFLATLRWQDNSGIRWAALAGLLFSLAIQVRETALFAPILTSAYVLRDHRKPRVQDILAAITGFALPFIIEFAVFAMSTGDPFYRLRLAISHTQIWSSELLGPIDRIHQPFFNKAYIAHWRLRPGLHVYWPIDGLLNLFVNGVAGLSLPFLTLSLLFGRQKLGDECAKRIMALYLFALTYMACLIYIFAIDPKPRMMLVALSMTSTGLALLTLRLRQIGYSLTAYSIWLAAAILGLTLQFGHQRTAMIEDPARVWIAELPGQIEIEPAARRYLALVPEAQLLPGLASNKPYVLFSSWMPCRRWIALSGLPAGSMTIMKSRSTLLLRPQTLGGELCLMRYDRPMPAEKMGEAIQRVRDKDSDNFGGSRYFFRTN